MLKENVTGLVNPLTRIFSQALDKGEVPEKWRMANICPIFKKGGKADPGNYRPVSLTCQAGKIFERIIKEEIMEYLEK